MMATSEELRCGDREGPGMWVCFLRHRNRTSQLVEVRNEDVFFPEEKNTQLSFGKTSGCDEISWVGRGGSEGIG
jgi:hypothetical protein